MNSAAKKWLLALILSLGSCYLSVHLFPIVFPLVKVQLKMDRLEAIQKGRTWLEAFHHDAYLESVASFQGQNLVQSFVELEAGGSEAFQRLLTHPHFRPFTWKVRHFTPKSIREASTVFTPEGEWWSFSETLSEEDKGAALSKEEALDRALQIAKEELHWEPLEVFTLHEQVATTVKSGRIDHQFTFKTKEEWGKGGSIRLTLSLSGDRLTSLWRWFHVPEDFVLRYNELRSKNHLVSSIAMQGAMAVVIVFGCILGGLWCYRQGHVRIRGALWMSLLLAVAQFLQSLNASPLAFLNYDTATSKTTFFFSLLIGFFKQSAYLGLLSFFLIVVADGLSSRAFPKHIPLFQSFSSQVVRTQVIRGSIWTGFLMLGYFFLDVTGTYYLGRTYLNWWVPSDQLANPDTLSHFLPAFGPLARASFAGIVEEVGLRAIPLALGALVGARFKRRTLGIMLMMLVQAIIFGGLHANYPAQPATARLIELILPSLVFGGLYLKYGLLPGMIAHFAFDAILMGIPIWVSTGAWLQKGILVLGTVAPLLYLMQKSRSFALPWTGIKLPSSLTYAAVVGSPQKQTDILHKHSVLRLGLKSLVCLITLTLGALAFFRMNPLGQPTFSNEVLTLTKEEALEIARDILEQRGFEALDFKANAVLISGPPIPQNSPLHFWLGCQGQAASRLQGLQAVADAGFIQKPFWQVSFINWHAPLPERARWIRVSLSSKTDISVRESIPDTIPLPSMTEEEAISFVGARIKKEPGTWTRLSIENKVYPTRSDWRLIYKREDLKQDGMEPRALYELSGTTLTHEDKWIHLTEDAFRQFKDHASIHAQWKEVCSLLFFALFFLQLFFLLPTAVDALEKQHRTSTLRYLFLFAALGLGMRLCTYPRRYEGFEVTSSLAQQWGLWLIFQSFHALWASTCLVLGWMHCKRYLEWKPLQTSRETIQVWCALFCGFLLRALQYIALGWGDMKYKALTIPQPFQAFQSVLLTEPYSDAHPLTLLNLSTGLILFAGWLRLLRRRSYILATLWCISAFLSYYGEDLHSLQGFLFFLGYLLILVWAGIEIFGTNLRLYLAGLAGCLFCSLYRTNQLTLAANFPALFILSLVPLFFLYTAFMKKPSNV